jgi:hypothetical protein
VATLLAALPQYKRCLNEYATWLDKHKAWMASQDSVEVEAAKRATALAARASTNKKEVAICACELTAATLAATALAKDKRHREEAAAEQRWVEEEHLMAPVEPPKHLDVAIRCILAKCALRAAPLNIILAEIIALKSLALLLLTVDGHLRMVR